MVEPAFLGRGAFTLKSKGVTKSLAAGERKKLKKTKKDARKLKRLTRRRSTAWPPRSPRG